MMQTQSFNEVKKEEWRRILSRRKLAGGEALTEKQTKDDDVCPEDIVGLALSGGGIRSASFNLGLLQVMARYDHLKQIDLLSTVSGGGYIGSSLSWFCSQLKQEFPYTWPEKSTPDQRKYVRENLNNLRAHGSYLIPGDGLNLSSFLAAIISGSLTTLIVLVPVFLAVISLLSENVFSKSLFIWAQNTGMMLLLFFIVGVLFYSVSTNSKKSRAAVAQRSTRELMGRLLFLGALFLIIGSIPSSYQLISTHFEDAKLWVFSNISFVGIATIAAAMFRSNPENTVKPLRSFLLTLGLLSIIYGAILWLYHLEHAPGLQIMWLPYACGLSLVLALFGDINHVSMHRFYRNRLMEAFMPSINESDDTKHNPDQCKLSEIPQTAFPYHIINTNMQTVGSSKARLQQRGGDSFILSPCFCGSKETGYLKTSSYVGNSMNLATAMAISGAAADANSYMTRSRPITFLMTLFNVRLGYWIRNPKHTTNNLKNFLRPMWYVYLFKDMFGRGLDEDAWNIHLSDGGHFENLGIYELVRRRCRFIIVSDAGRDPNFQFSDFGRAVERVRADFGVIIDIDLSNLNSWQPDNTMKPYAIGTINYGLKDCGDCETGILLLIKSSLIKEMPADVVAYHAQNNDFPDQSTGDQFFDEEQFEAYRELGFATGKQLFKPEDPEQPLTLPALIKAMLADNTK